MTLARAYFNLERRLSWADESFKSQYRLASKALTSEEIFILNGIVDYVWQAWTRFSREYFIKCCLGCNAKNGAAIAAALNVQPISEERVSYLSTMLSRPQKITVNGMNSILRYEPTWGDIDKIINLSALCQLSNHAAVTASFGGGLLGPKHLQRVRNSIAHLNKETHIELNSLASLYKSNTLRHPVCSVFWRTTDTDVYALSAWIEDMLLIADVATEA